MLADTLTDSGVDLLAQRRDEPTSLAVVSLNAGAPNYLVYRENTAERMVSFKALMNLNPENSNRILCRVFGDY